MTRHNSLLKTNDHFDDIDLFSTLKMDAADSSEMLVARYVTTRHKP
jgi:hypothetical protein